MSERAYNCIIIINEIMNLSPPKAYGMVWCGMVWYGMVWHGMVWYGMVWYGAVWYGMVEVYTEGTACAGV